MFYFFFLKIAYIYFYEFYIIKILKSLKHTVDLIQFADLAPG